MPHILIIDDDTELSDLLKELLAFEHFTVTSAYDGEEGIALINESIDMILLDVMMPKLNGFDTLKKIREQWEIPVLMLTAKGDEIDRVIGLELGADDYLPKPFSERELLARIRAILRRANGKSDKEKTSKVHQDRIEYDDLVIYPGKLEAYHKQELIDLTGTEFALLHYFLLHPGQVVTKESLSFEVLGKRLAVFDRAIDMHVSNLRKKLPDSVDNKPRIKTLRGRGYLLVAE
ncbi:Transcriptional regulatory protein YycF [Marinomonas spartinae]|uniref:Transcriptional regulatory protein YycF n=1 Tax=Marinomonas spartinae TaxID=1792290 RepID=A0A1A8TQH4_9GAMM|nr:response regulator [Marinomonas spartinae]SBS35691.1 Transcriptional regulatory protein YycF [Marinomonas spartinae]